MFFFWVWSASMRRWTDDGKGYILPTWIRIHEIDERVLITCEWLTLLKVL